MKNRRLFQTILFLASIIIIAVLQAMGTSVMFAAMFGAVPAITYSIIAGIADYRAFFLKKDPQLDDKDTLRSPQYFSSMTDLISTTTPIPDEIGGGVALSVHIIEERILINDSGTPIVELTSAFTTNPEEYFQMEEIPFLVTEEAAESIDWAYPSTSALAY